MPSDFRLPDALSGLGEPLQVHPSKAAAGRTGYFTVAGVLLILSGLSVIGVVNPPQHNPPPQIVVISAMVAFFVFSVAFFVMGMLSQSYSLILFPDALVRAGGEATEIFRWSDVRDVYAYVNPVGVKCRVVTKDGRKLQIDTSVKEGKKLEEDVRQAIFDHMLPGALEAFERGTTLTFGPLRIDQSYLYYKDKRLSWNEVAKMQLLYNAYTRSVQFEVNAAGSVLLPWCSVKMQDIPNVDVFKTLAERKQAFTQ